VEHGPAVGWRIPATGYRLDNPVRCDHAGNRWEEDYYEDRAGASSSQLIAGDWPKIKPAGAIDPC